MSAVRWPGAVTGEMADIFEFWTPSEVRNYVATVGAGFTALADDLGRNPTVFSEAEKSAWTKVLGNFIEFYKNMGFFSTLSMSPVRTAETYAAQLAYYRQLYTHHSGQAATGADIVIPSMNQEKTMDMVRLLAIVAGIGAAGYLASQLLQTAKVFR